MRRLKQFVPVLFMAFLAVLAIAPAGSAAARTKAGDTPPIYVLRGGLDIFSTGMNVLAHELTIQGIPAQAVSFDDWHGYLAKIVAAYRKHPYRVILIGHSYGANTILLMAYELQKSNIPVDLLVFYDLTDSAKVPDNVRHVLNFRSSSSTGIDVTVGGGFDFTGTIQNVTRPDLNHITIDKAEDLHKQTISEIMRLLHRHPRTAER